jgi:peptide/nickel transport system permease protein
MASEHISYYVAKPWLVLVPGLAILVVVIGFTLLSDALRDAFDPRYR